MNASSAQLRELAFYFGSDVLRAPERRGEVPPVRISVTGVPNLRTEGLRDLGDDLRGSADALVDQTYGVRIERGPDRGWRLEVAGALPEWLSWCMAMALLESGATFVHAAGVARDGKALLIPSWGGVGKTALTRRLVMEEGWQLLGDDLVIVDAQGRCFGFPKPMVLYPYHRDVFPEVFRAARGPRVPSRSLGLLTAVTPAIKSALRPFPGLLRFARERNPQSVRLAPSEVFGPERLAPPARVHAVLWLDRVQGLHAPRFVRDDPSLVSRVTGSTIREFDHRCIIATHVLAGLGMVSYRDVFSRWEETVRSAFTGAWNGMLFVPESMTFGELQATVVEHLRELP